MDGQSEIDGAVDDDSASGDSDDMQENTCDTVEFYVGLLMKLVPSLERLHKQSATAKQDGSHSLPLPMASLSQSALDDPIDTPKPGSLGQMSQNQQTLGTNEVDISTERKFVGKDPADLLGLGERFESLWQSKRQSSTGGQCRFLLTLGYLMYD